MSEAERRPWERSRGESRQAFAAFTIYLDQGAERTIQGAWEQHVRQTREGQPEGQEGAVGRSPGRWRTWATKWHWVARADARDDWLHEQEESARLDAALQAVSQREAERQRRVEEDSRELWNTVDQIRTAKRVLAGCMQLALPPLRKLLEMAQAGDASQHPQLMKLMPHLPKLGTAFATLSAQERQAVAQGLRNLDSPAERTAAEATGMGKQPDEMTLEELRAEFDRIRLALD